LQYIHKLAQHGFVAASIEYKDYADYGGFKAKAQLLTNGSDSAMGVLCALDVVDCSLGIATMGYSQGGHLALLVATVMDTVPAQPKVTATYLISSGLFNKELMSTGGGNDNSIDNDQIQLFVPKEKRRYTFFVGDEIFGPTVEDELHASKTLSGYDCDAKLDCFQADGSGYQVIPQDAVPASVPENSHHMFVWHAIWERNDHLIWDWFLDGNSSWSANKGIEWLTHAARTTKISKDQATQAPPATTTTVADTTAASGTTTVADTTAANGTTTVADTTAAGGTTSVGTTTMGGQTTTVTKIPEIPVEAVATCTSAAVAGSETLEVSDTTKLTVGLPIIIDHGTAIAENNTIAAGSRRLAATARRLTGGAVKLTTPLLFNHSANASITTPKASTTLASTTTTVQTQASTTSGSTTTVAPTTSGSTTTVQTSQDIFLRKGELAMPIYRPWTVKPPPSLVKQGIIHLGRGDYVSESLPNYDRFKYELIRWFEDRAMCPHYLASHGFPAWVGRKWIRAAAPAITTPRKGVAGNRTLIVHNFAPNISSKDFTCVKEHGELKARTAPIILKPVRIRIDDWYCTLKDISFYILGDDSNMVGMRLDFFNCRGAMTLRADQHAHFPKTASLNMELSDAAISQDPGNHSLDKFIHAVCNNQPPHDFLTSLLPTFDQVDRKPGLPNRTEPVCFAQTASAEHVSGQGCYDDFAFFDLTAFNGYQAKIPVNNLESIRKLIPGKQDPTPGMTVSARRLNPIPGVTDSARKLAANPCTTEAPPNPCTTERPLKSPATCGCTTGMLRTCKPYDCIGKHSYLVANPDKVWCHNTTGCTAQDSDRCCIQRDMTTTTTTIYPMPGRVIVDRLCLYFEGMPCANDCRCTDSLPAKITTTTLPPPPPHQFCMDCWEESLVAAIIGGLLTFLFSRRIIVEPLKRKARKEMEDAVDSDVQTVWTKEKLDARKGDKVLISEALRLGCTYDEIQRAIQSGDAAMMQLILDKTPKETSYLEGCCSGPVKCIMCIMITLTVLVVSFIFTVGTILLWELFADWLLQRDPNNPPEWLLKWNCIRLLTQLKKVEMAYSQEGKFMYPQDIVCPWSAFPIFMVVFFVNALCPCFLFLGRRVVLRQQKVSLAEQGVFGAGGGAGGEQGLVTSAFSTAVGGQLDGRAYATLRGRADATLDARRGTIR
jgi:hypothetical protein